eukprot:Pgem_evm1s5411
MELLNKITSKFYKTIFTIFILQFFSNTLSHREELISIFEHGGLQIIPVEEAEKGETILTSTW